MKFQAILASGLALAGVAFAAPAPASAVVPDPSQVYIQSISYGGTGCPQGTVGISLSADRTTFTLIFDEYVASVGPGVSVIQNRKNCQINVNLHYPSGFQYSILGVDARGFVALDKGVTATQKTTYYFSGEQIQASTQTDFSGPVSKDYLIHDEIPFTSTVWAPCGQVQALNINSQVRLENAKNSSGSGLLTTDSLDGKVTFVVGVSWQTCKK